MVKTDFHLNENLEQESNFEICQCFTIYVVETWIIKAVTRRSFDTRSIRNKNQV